jgi:hypothetical protein
MSANSAVLLKDQDKLRIPKITPRGELWFFIDIAQVINYSPEQIVEMATSLGYAPELRIAEYLKNGQSTLEPVLLLHRQVLPTMDRELGFEEAIPQRFLDDWEQLASEIEPSTAVHLRRGT